MHVHRLYADLSGSGKPVCDEAHRAEEAGRKALDIRLHFYRRVLVQPASRLDINLLAGRERSLEHVAVSVQPEYAMTLVAMEFIDKEAGSAEKHVRRASHPFEGVIN